MRSMDKLERQRGFTLVEVSILLSVIVILSATIAPVMGGVMDAARLNAARSDMTAIAQALQAFLDDISCVFVPQNNTAGADRQGRSGGGRGRSSSVVVAPTEVPPTMPPTGDDSGAMRFSAALAASACSAGSVCSGDAVEIMVSAGDVPAEGPEAGSDWLDSPDGRWVDFLEYYLISNTPGDDASRGFPTLEDCGDVVADLFNSLRAWQGAYLNVGAGDPWGNRYAVNTYLLTQTTGEDVVILSAGPDEEIDSPFYMDGFVAGDDDIALIFSSGPTEVPER